MRYSNDRRFRLPMFCVLTGPLLFVSPVTGWAQHSDAASGECFVETTRAAQTESGAQGVVVGEAYEITRPVKAQFATVDEPVMVRESFDELTVKNTEFEVVTDSLEIQPPEQRWTTTIGDQRFSTSKDTLEQIAGTGIQLESMPAGVCFTEHVIDARYEDVEEQVLVREAYDKITVVPAKFETTEERIEVREAYSNTIGVPAVFRTESETVLVEPEREALRLCNLLEPADRTPGEVVCKVRLPERYETLTRAMKVSSPKIKTIQIPAAYRTVEVQRMVEPAKEVLESVPAVYETVTKRVKVQDARFLWLQEDAMVPADARVTGRAVCLEDIPAKRVPVQRQIVAKPAFTEATMVSAEFSTVATEKLVSPASQENLVIPVVIRAESESVATASEPREWYPVLCDDDSTPQTVAAIQIALQREGFSPGPVDGIVGPMTLDAVEDYQIENNLVTGGITLELLDSLEVQPPD